MTAADLGVVVNPVAGMGGRVGLHGTDTHELERARSLGAVPVAPDRARRALGRLHELAPSLRALVAEAAMGADYLPTPTLPAGWPVTTVPVPAGITQAKDTTDVVREMVRRGVRLVLFVGGDGTARDVAAAAADVPVLGVPAGVKMHSGVFGLTPEASAEAAARFLSSNGTPATALAEVVDRDDDGVVRLHGTVTVPVVPAAVQRRKASTGPTDADLAGLGREVADQMHPGRLYLLGPGTTVATVSAALGLPATLLGVDAVLDGALLARDAGESELLRLLEAHPVATVVLGVVGGQGFLLGRGNQQLSPAVLRAVGVAGEGSLEILASPGKVAGLVDPVLRVDLDDNDLARQLLGYRRVRTARGRSTVLRVVA